MMSAEPFVSQDPSKPVKLCFVTVGATASFNSLVREVLSEPFLAALQANSYTDLLIQYGQQGEAIFEDFEAQTGPTTKEKYGLEIAGFDFNVEGLRQEMMLVKARPDFHRQEGLIISHAGSGTILEALRFGVPLVVVPNPELLHNHQVELAKQLSSVGYVLYGNLGALTTCVGDAEDFRRRLHAWPPANSGGGESGKGLAGVMEDELGFVD